MDNNVINKIKKTMYDNLSYTNQDYESIMVEMLDLVQSGALPTQWNNLTETDPIVLLLSMVAAHKDMLNYMIDFRVLESYMSTARMRQSMIRIADSHGYKIPGYSSARVRYVLDKNTLDSGKTYELKPFTSMVDSNGVSWVYVGKPKETVTPEGTTYTIEGETFVKEVGLVNIDLYQGTVESITFNASSIDPISMTKVIAATNVAMSNVFDARPMARLIYGGTQEFKQVNLTQTQEQHNHIYEMATDVNDMTYIRFPKSLATVSYTGNYEMTYVNTLGETNITPDNNIEIPMRISMQDVEKVNTDLEPNTYIVGKNIATPDEIKEGFKNFYAGISSLVTVHDYANYVKNVQRVVPNVSKVFVLDKQTDSNRGTGDNAITDLTVAVYATKLVGSNHIALTPEDIAALKEDLTLHKITGVKIAINENGASSHPLTALEGGNKIKLKIDSDIVVSPTHRAQIESEITKLLLNTNIGATLNIRDITDMLLEKDLSKYFGFGGSIRFDTSSGDKMKQELLFNQYVKEVQYTWLNN